LGALGESWPKRIPSYERIETLKAIGYSVIRDGDGYWLYYQDSSLGAFDSKREAWDMADLIDSSFFTRAEARKL
jgi:hypothetical protein